MNNRNNLRAMGAFPVARRKAVTMSPIEMVRTGLLPNGQPLPLVIEPIVEAINLPVWAAENREWIDRLLMEHRALLFRGFPVATPAVFEQFVTATSGGQMLEYRDRSSPRHAVRDRIYTSTDYPHDQSIALHNEGTYWLKWPLKIYFHCAIQPGEGGATPIADTRRIFARLRTETRDRFIARQVLYQRNFNLGFGLTWQLVFQTTERSSVEEYCRQNDIEWEWRGNDQLRTRQRRPAVAMHPCTGEQVWFNHAAFFHVSSLEAAMRETLISEFGEDNLPYQTYYGDGGQIEPETLDELRAAYQAEKLSFPWQTADILLLDNMSVAHGRDPYEGARQILVGMADPHGRNEKDNA